MKARTQNKRVQANVESVENWTVISAGRALCSGIVDQFRLPPVGGTGLPEKVILISILSFV